MRIIVLTVAALVVVSCSSGTTSSGGGGCLTNAECESTLALASPTPSGCAEATCDLTTGRCKFTARDQDGDGDGDGERALICTGTEAIATGTDCDDLTPAINTTAIERCESSNIDENCNGMINEGCACPGPRTSGSPLAGRRARQSPVASFVQNDLP